jgi:hypothetical protein
MIKINTAKVLDLVIGSLLVVLVVLVHIGLFA